MQDRLPVGLCVLCVYSMHFVSYACVPYMFLGRLRLVLQAATELTDTGQVVCWPVRIIFVVCVFCVSYVWAVYVSFGPTLSGPLGGNRAY